MAVKTVNLGGTASHITVGKVAHGLMMMTTRFGSDNTLSDEDAFTTIKAGVDAMPHGVKLFLNSAEFYGPGHGTANLELPSRFYEKYPGYTEKTFLSVKGGTKQNTLFPDSSAENLRRSVDACIAALRGTKKIDLFETARVAQNVPLEDAMQTLIKLKDEGKFDHLGMSECRAETLKKANAIYPIAAVEIEVSLWSYEDEVKKVIQTSGELGIPVVAYSPLGRGLLTGSIRNRADVPEGDFRRMFSRFQEENMKANLVIVDAITTIADKKGVTIAELCIAWVASRGPHVIPLPGSSNTKRTLQNIAAGDLELTQAELDEIADVLAKYEVKGARYLNGDAARVLHLWG